MKKIKIERSYKLRREEIRNKDYDVITNNYQNENDWLNSYAGQKEKVLPIVQSTIEKFHDEKAHIANGVTQADRENEKMRINMDYKPKMNITHSSSIRYAHNPKDN